MPDSVYALIAAAATWHTTTANPASTRAQSLDTERALRRAILALTTDADAAVRLAAKQAHA